MKAALYDEGPVSAVGGFFPRLVPTPPPSGGPLPKRSIPPAYAVLERGPRERGVGRGPQYRKWPLPEVGQILPPGGILEIVELLPPDRFSNMQARFKCVLCGNVTDRKIFNARRASTEKCNGVCRARRKEASSCNPTP